MKAKLIIALTAVLSGCATFPIGQPRFLLVSHDVKPLGSDVQLTVTLKLDSATGEVWRREPIAFTPVPVEPVPTHAHALKHEPSLLTKQQTAATTIRLNRIVIPRIDLKGSSFADAIDFLAEASVEHDPDHIGIGICVDYPRKDPIPKEEDNPWVVGELDFEAVPRVTVSAESISLLDAIELVCAKSGMRYRIVGQVVLISPANIVEHAFVAHHSTLRPATVSRLKSQRPQLFDTKATQEEINNRWRNYFEEYGVRWSDDSRGEFDPMQGRVSMFAAPDTRDRIDEIINLMDAYPPRCGRYQLVETAADASPMLFDTDAGEAWQYQFYD